MFRYNLKGFWYLNFTAEQGGRPLGCPCGPMTGTQKDLGTGVHLRLGAMSLIANP